VWLDPLIFIKYFLEKKISLSHHTTKEKKTKEKYPFAFSKHPIPHHQKNNSLNYFLNPTFLPSKTTKPIFPMPPKKQTFGLIPIPKKIHLSQSLKKNLLWKGVELSHPPFLTQKQPF
jgi:hypothetical protein